jgi:hypothetical protein
MAVKKYFSDADNTITNAFRESLQTRGTEANMGLADVLETFSIYGQESSGSTELERILIKFPTNQIAQDRLAGIIPEQGSVTFYLNMYNAPHNQTTPREGKLVVLPVSQSWQEGTGLDMEEYKDVTNGGVGSNWINASEGAPWLREGGDYLNSPSYSQTFPKGNEDLRIDVTNLVEQWIDGTIPDYGVGVHFTSSQEAYYAGYYPREAVNFDGQAFLSGAGVGDMSDTGEFTFSTWINPSATVSSRYIGFWISDSLTSGIRYLYRNGAGNILYTSVYSGNNLQFTGPVVPQDSWSHIALTHNPTDLSTPPTLYINGVSSSIVMASFPPTGTPASAVAFSLGGWPDPGDTNWKGLIDDAAYFDKVLAQEEITSLYNSGCPAPLKEADFYSSLKHWWVHGDDPRDEIRLGSPPSEASIYDRVGSLDLYATGSGDMSIQEGACSGQDGTIPLNSNEIINTSGAKDTFYTKKFFGRGSEFFFKRPIIEAVWDSSIKDDRGNFYASSSLLPASENTRTLYLHNAIGGRLRNIPAVGTGQVNLRIFTEKEGGTQLSTGPIVGGYVSTGVYSASFSLDTTASVVYDRWYDPSFTECYYTGTLEIKNHQAVGYNPYPNYVTSLTNLRPIYYTHETNRFRFYVREKDWSPTIYTVATKKNDTLVIESGSYQIHRVIDDMVVLPFSTGSNMGTEMSFDVSGNYFDFKMDFLEPGYSYGIKVAYYDETVNSYVEQPYIWKFRVEEV